MDPSVAGKRLPLLPKTSAEICYALADAVNRGMTKEDLKAFTDDAVVADFQDFVHHSERDPLEIHVLRAVAAKTVDSWKKHTTKRVAFDELAKKLKVGAEKVEKWKEIPESLNAEKRSAEKVVFDCVEDLDRAVKRLKGRDQTVITKPRKRVIDPHWD